MLCQSKSKVAPSAFGHSFHDFIQQEHTHVRPPNVVGDRFSTVSNHDFDIREPVEYTVDAESQSVHGNPKGEAVEVGNICTSASSGKERSTRAVEMVVNDLSVTPRSAIYAQPSTSPQLQVLVVWGKRKCMSLGSKLQRPQENVARRSPRLTSGGYTQRCRAPHTFATAQSAIKRQCWRV